MSHRWKFFRAGGFDQVRLDSSADLLALGELDQKLWVALACPTTGLQFDKRTLDLIDTEKNGRIRAPQIIAAVKWACSMLKDPGDILKSPASLPISAINDRNPEGARILASARQILSTLGRDENDAITTEDTADTAKIFSLAKYNGDGNISIETADDEATRALITDIISCVGSDADPSGKPGISQQRVDAFFAEAKAYDDWWKKAEAEKERIFVLGEATAAAAAAIRAVKAKADDYFARCELAAFDQRAAAALNRQESDYMTLAAKDLSISSGEIALMPMARIEASKPLHLKSGLNPAWLSAVSKMHSEAVVPVFGDKDCLSASEWKALCSKFTAYEDWNVCKTGTAVEKLGLQRVRSILSGNGKATLSAIIAIDKSLEQDFRAITSVEKLVRLRRDLYPLLNNFVAFRDFYTRKAKAVFQAGTLYLDGRTCEMCVRVEDAAKHSTIAASSRIFLAYCDCTRRAAEGKMTIAAAFTDGDSDFLMVGRSGIFYDRDGKDWDATIVKLVDHPISIRQAFWSPYKRFGNMIREQAEKMAAAKEKDVQAQAAAGIEETRTRLETAKPAQAVPFDIARFAGIFAAIGLAVGAIGTAMATIVTGLIRLSWWKMPLAVIGFILAISGPSMILAWIKLRQRNLGPVLDACGWAMNARAKINLAFGKSLTSIAKLPAGSERSLHDPYADKKNPWPGIFSAAFVIGGALYALYSTGRLQQCMRWMMEIIR